MKPVVTYALVAVLMVCVVGYVARPLVEGLTAAVNTINRTLRRGNDHAE